PIADNSTRECRSWQQVSFERQRVKAVTLKGIADTANNMFHVVEVEGFDDGAIEKIKQPKRMPPHAPVKSAGNLKPGIWAEYFDGLDHYASAEDTPDLARVQSGLNFGASTQAPAGQDLRNWPFAGACAAVFSGFLMVEKTCMYTVFLESENGSRLYI